MQIGLRALFAALLGAVLAGGCASFDGLAPKSVGTDAAALAASRSLAGVRLSPAACRLARRSAAHASAYPA